MEKPIKELEKHFDEGLLRLNWTALRIPDYAGSLKLAISQFEGDVAQVNKVAKDVRHRVVQFRKASLFKEPPYKKTGYSLPILDCWDFFQYWEKHRNEVWDNLLLQYRGLPALFDKLETLIYNTSTGKHKQFKNYYQKWDTCIFKFMAK